MDSERLPSSASALESEVEVTVSSVVIANLTSAFAFTMPLSYLQLEGISERAVLASDSQSYSTTMVLSP